jgi:hypothetical protein
VITVVRGRSVVCESIILLQDLQLGEKINPAARCIGRGDREERKREISAN